MNYYHGEGNVSLLKPDRDDHNQWLNWHTNFTEKNFKEGKDECFMHITDDWKPDRVKAA